MAGFLDDGYGVSEERRSRLIKRVLLALLVVIVVGGIGTFMLYDFRQERQVKRFFERLQAGDYTAAYELWGCTQAKPCRAYPMRAFMQDWGPQSPHGGLKGYSIARSRTCGNGVIITVNIPEQQQERLWVDRQSLVVGFSPFPTSNCRR
jgi:hypothetical protein